MEAEHRALMRRLWIFVPIIAVLTVFTWYLK